MEPTSSSDILRLGLDIHVAIFSHLQALDILNLAKTCKTLAYATKHRIVWQNAFKNALSMECIPLAAYKHIIDAAPTRQLIGMASIPSRLTRRLHHGGLMTPISKSLVYDPEGYEIRLFGFSADARFLVTQSSPKGHSSPKKLSIWDITKNDTHTPILCHRNDISAGEEIVTQTGVCRDQSGIWVWSITEVSEGIGELCIHARKFLYDTAKPTGKEEDNARVLKLSNLDDVPVTRVVGDILIVFCTGRTGMDTILVWDVVGGQYAYIRVRRYRTESPQDIYAFGSHLYLVKPTRTEIYPFPVPQTPTISSNDIALDDHSGDDTEPILCLPSSTKGPPEPVFRPVSQQSHPQAFLPPYLLDIAGDNDSQRLRWARIRGATLERTDIDRLPHLFWDKRFRHSSCVRGQS